MKNSFKSLFSFFDNLKFNYKTAFLMFIIAGGMICIIILSQISIFAIKQDFDVLFDKRTKSLMQLENVKDTYKVNIENTLSDFQKKQISNHQVKQIIELAQEIIDNKQNLAQIMQAQADLKNEKNVLQDQILDLEKKLADNQSVIVQNQKKAENK